MNPTKNKLHPTMEVLMLKTEREHRRELWEQNKANALSKLYRLKACLPGKSKAVKGEIEQEVFRISSEIHFEHQQTLAFLAETEAKIQQLLNRN